MLPRAKLGVALLAFLVSIAVAGVGAGVAKVYFFHSYDPKYRGDPGSAFQLELIQVALLLAVGGVLFTTTRLVVDLYRNPRVVGLSAAVAALAGAFYPLGLHLLARVLQSQFDLESSIPPIVAWSYIVLYPLAAAIPMRSRSPS